MAKVTRKIHSIDHLGNPFTVGIVPYVVEEGPHDLTLVDTCFSADFDRLEDGFRDEGYDIKDVKRLVLTHTHADHTQAANKVIRASGAKVYSHWAEVGYLERNPPYHGPPTEEMLQALMRNTGLDMEKETKRFGTLEVEPIAVDVPLKEGDSVCSLKVLHTPGHTPGHISLLCEQERTLIGGDLLFKSVLRTEGLFVPDSNFSIDPVVAALSARRASAFRFDRLVLGHQDAPVLDGASAAVARAAAAALRKGGNGSPQ